MARNLILNLAASGEEEEYQPDGEGEADAEGEGSNAEGDDNGIFSVSILDTNLILFPKLLNFSFHSATKNYKVDSNILPILI